MESFQWSSSKANDEQEEEGRKMLSVTVFWWIFDPFLRTRIIFERTDGIWENLIKLGQTRWLYLNDYFDPIILDAILKKSISFCHEKSSIENRKI